MIKEVDDELKNAIDDVMPLVNDVFNMLLNHLEEADKIKIQTLTKAFEDMGIQYDVNFKVSAIKKNFDDLDLMLKDLLEIKV